MSVQLLHGDCREVLKTLPAESVHCCVTSPPYFGLRDYGHDGQIGLEPTPDEFVAELVAVFREVRRVLRPDGTLWLNLGDSYVASACGVKEGGVSKASGLNGAGSAKYRNTLEAGHGQTVDKTKFGLPPKNLLGIPWRVAFALQANGWYLRQDIIWHKPNPMPESVTDRCTKAHEYVFLLSKSARYFYDADAVSEPSAHPHLAGKSQKVNYSDESALRNDGDRVAIRTLERNKRSVWSIATQPYSGAHFATMAPELAETCIKAGCPSHVCDECGTPAIPDHQAPFPMRCKQCDCARFNRGVVLDPFGGAGTTGLVADRLQRDALLIELNPAYADIAQKRIVGDAPLFAEVAA